MARAGWAGEERKIRKKGGPRGEGAGEQGSGYCKGHDLPRQFQKKNGIKKKTRGGENNKVTMAGKPKKRGSKKCEKGERKKEKKNTHQGGKGRTKEKQK